MHCAHVDVDGVEQQRRAVQVRVEPALERDLFEMLRLSRARLDFRLIQVLEISLLPIVRFGADGGNIQAMGGFHVGSVVEAANERISSDVDRAFDVTIAPQRKIRQPAITRSHPKLHRHAGRCHRQIEGVLEFDLLRLGEAELAGDVGNWLLCKHDRARADRANGPGKLDVFDGLRKSLQPAAILLEKTQPRPINLAVNQEADQALVTQHWSERKFSLGHIKGGKYFAEGLAMHAGGIFIRRIAHRGVIAINIQRAH